MEIYNVTLIELSSKKEIPCSVEVDEAEISENIKIKTVIDGNTIEVTDFNYLPAYQHFRDQLLLLGYGMKCNGSRINAVQSGLMGATDKMYLVEIGKQALMKDIVHIWDYADIVEFPDIEQQKVFFDQWTKSLSKS